MIQRLNWEFKRDLSLDLEDSTEGGGPNREGKALPFAVRPVLCLSLMRLQCHNLN